MRLLGGVLLVVGVLVGSFPGGARAQMEFSLDETDEVSPPESRKDLIEELAGQSQEQSAVEEGPKRQESAEEIYAVQQIYALRLKRFELAPSAAFTLNDPFLSHGALSVAANYWFTNVLAVGFNFLWYDFGGNPLEQQGGFTQRIQRSFRLGVPINQWQLGAYANFTYVPFYGKFSMFRKFIFQWDAYVVGGVGIMRTRPIPVFDPEFRAFDYGLRAAFNVGLGIRIFLTRYLGIFTEFRNYMFLERFENTQVEVLSQSDRSTWHADSASFFNNATVHFGVTVFFPFKFEYRLPK